MFGFLGGLVGKAASALGVLGGGSKLAGALGLAKGAVEIAGGIKGMKTPDAVTPYDNLMSQAKGARDAAAEYGFNPLTMLQFGQTGAMTSSGGAAPLASIQLLTDGLSSIDDMVSGDRARRRAVDQLNQDMAQIQYDQARSGVVFAPQSATNWPNDPAPFGRRAVTVLQDGSADVYGRPARFGGGNDRLVQAAAALGQGSSDNGDSGNSFGLRPLSSASAVDPRRSVDNSPVKTHSGFVEIDNPWLPFKIHVPTMDGDEPVQWYDLPSVALWGATSMAGEVYRRVSDGLRDPNREPFLSRREFETPYEKRMREHPHPKKRPNAGGAYSPRF